MLLPIRRGWENIGVLGIANSDPQLSFHRSSIIIIIIHQQNHGPLGPFIIGSILFQMIELWDSISINDFEFGTKLSLAMNSFITVFYISFLRTQMPINNKSFCILKIESLSRFSSVGPTLLCCGETITMVCPLTRLLPRIYFTLEHTI